MTDFSDQDGGCFLYDDQEKKTKIVERLIVHLLHLHANACCVQSSAEDLLSIALAIMEGECCEQRSPSNYRETGKAEIIGDDGQVDVRHKDCSSFPKEVGAATVEGEGRLTGFAHLSGNCKIDARIEGYHGECFDLIEHMALGLTHELKQPLAALNAYLGVARKTLKERSSSANEIDDVLNKMSNQVFRISEIVDNMRQFMARGVTDKTLQKLNEVVRTACEFTDSLAAESGVSTTLRLGAEEDMVIVNKVLIQQVIVNLKRNAIEAMQGRERREMAISTRLVDGGAICVEVADTGPGLPETVKAKLFKPFITTKPQGLGVGLSISHWIIEAHHGRMWAEENPGGGTIFSFVLPLARS